MRIQEPVINKELVKQIKKEQVLSTLPGAIFPGGGGVIAYIYNKTRDASDMNIK